MALRILAIITRDETMCKQLDEMGILEKCERFVLNQINSPSVMFVLRRFHDVESMCFDCLHR